MITTYLSPMSRMARASSTTPTAKRPSGCGSVDIADGDAELASAMVGDQGVRVSPLAMALAAGAVADGSWHGPTLVREEGPSPAGANELDEAHLEVVREGLRDAVSLRIPEVNVGEEQVYGQAARTEQDGAALFRNRGNGTFEDVRLLRKWPIEIITRLDTDGSLQRGAFCFGLSLGGQDRFGAIGTTPGDVSRVDGMSVYGLATRQPATGR